MIKANLLTGKSDTKYLTDNVNYQEPNIKFRKGKELY